ncbi:UNVERIFIED_CONTAM: hypothetical protein GTU68_067319 [Idotea baltica]|nr:hypothetical protein [Idotea baltica]
MAHPGQTLESPLHKLFSPFFFDPVFFPLPLYLYYFFVKGKTLPLGNLEIHPLSRLNRVGSGRSSGDVLSPTLADIALAEEVTFASTGLHTSHHPEDQNFGSPSSDVSLSTRNKIKNVPAPTFHISKLFEIDNCKGNGKVVIAYPGRFESFPEASFWFVDLSLRPHLLSLDVLTYWRLLLVHLGMPQWQALASGIGLTPWARQWYEILSPHILEGAFRQHKIVQPDLVNKLDWSAFKTKKVHKNRPKTKSFNESLASLQKIIACLSRLKFQKTVKKKEQSYF